MFQLGTSQRYPTIVFEVAVSNQERNRLLNDADTKIFSVHTSIAIWVGLKVDLHNNVFWAGWGRRSLTGSGIRLEEQTEDENGVASFLPIFCPHPQTPLGGGCSIPSTLVYDPLPVPPDQPINLILSIESMRAAIEMGLEFM
jgi:hypothetical protein